MPRPDILTLCAAQIASHIGDIDRNLEEHKRRIDEARALGADLLVFPELSLVGHYGAERLLEVTLRRDDPRLLALSQYAGDMTIVLGFIEEGPAAQFYNAAAMFRNGKLVYLHRKVNLPSYGRLMETKYYAQGRFVDNHAYNEYWRIGLLICADLWNPGLTHLSFLHGATLLITPISSGIEAVGDAFDNPAGWNATMHFYSMMYGAPSMMVNRVGTEEDLTFWGGSQILDPFGKVLARAGSEPELICATIDYHQVRQARALLPTVRDSNVDLLARETGRLLNNLGVPDIVRQLPEDLA
jgi:N-carbamoylputrescine amidase